MNIFDSYYEDRKNILADFLKVKRIDIKTCSDYSFKVSGRIEEYYILNDNNVKDMELLGESEGYYIYVK